MDKFLVIDLDMDIRTARSHFEKKYILAQIKKFNGNISKTANFIGMDRTALHRKMKDLNILPNERYRNIIGY
jgi:two-component system nitrogen regulation response regulator NtrX